MDDISFDESWQDIEATLWFRLVREKCQNLESEDDFLK